MNSEQRARELLAEEVNDGQRIGHKYYVDEEAAIRAIARALEQREGFVMVPREPTPEMVNAACAIKLRRLTEFASGKDGSGIEAGIREDYAAMLAAAPPPTPPEEPTMSEAEPCR